MRIAVAALLALAACENRWSGEARSCMQSVQDGAGVEACLERAGH